MTLRARVPGAHCCGAGRVGLALLPRRSAVRAWAGWSPEQPYLAPRIAVVGAHARTHLADPTIIPLLSMPVLLVVVRVGAGGVDLSVSDVVLFVAFWPAVVLGERPYSPADARRCSGSRPSTRRATLFTVVANPYTANVIEWFHAWFLTGGALIVGWALGRAGRGAAALTPAAAGVVRDRRGYGGAGGCPPGAALEPVYPELPFSMHKNFAGTVLASRPSSPTSTRRGCGGHAGWPSPPSCSVPAACSSPSRGRPSSGSPSRSPSSCCGGRDPAPLQAARPRRRGRARFRRHGRPRPGRLRQPVQLGVPADQLVAGLHRHLAERPDLRRGTAVVVHRPVPRPSSSRRTPSWRSSPRPGSSGCWRSSSLAVGTLVVLWRLDPVYGTLGTAVVLSRFVQGQFDLFWTAVQVSVPFVIAGHLPRRSGRAREQRRRRAAVDRSREAGAGGGRPVTTVVQIAPEIGPGSGVAAVAHHLESELDRLGVATARITLADAHGSWLPEPGPGMTGKAGARQRVVWFSTVGTVVARSRLRRPPGRRRDLPQRRPGRRRLRQPRDRPRRHAGPRPRDRSGWPGTRCTSSPWPATRCRFGSRTHRVVVNLTAEEDDLLRATYPRVTPATVVIGNGVDTRRLRPPTDAERAAARGTYGFGPDDVVVLFVGHEFDRKGLPVLVDAVARHPDRVHLLVVGGTSDLIDGARRPRPDRRLRRPGALRRPARRPDARLPRRGRLRAAERLRVVSASSSSRRSPSACRSS